MKKLIFIFAIAAIIIVGYLAYQYFTTPVLFKDYQRKKIKIGNTSYILYVVDTEPKRMQGLSGVAQMPLNQGMLFMFDKPQPYGFWMKEMNFSLDLVYAKNNQVVDLKENISPSTYPEIFYPQSPVDAVVELNAGQIKQNTVKVGDSISIFK